MAKSRNKKRVLITGIAGFAGSYLAEYLLNKNYDVYGFLAPREKDINIKHLKNDLILDRFDILKAEKVLNFIKKSKPEYIFHLAAFSSVGLSFRHEKLTFDVNFTGTFNILKAVTDLKQTPKKIIYISSPDIYGHFKSTGKKLTETQPFSPISPYAVSKIAAENLCQFYFQSHKLPIVIVRPFNHTGPRQITDFVVPSFCKQIAEIEKGKKQPKMSVGDLSVKRDLSDVRDIVRGYYLLARSGRPGQVYHLCSSHAVSIRDVLSKLRKMATVPINVNEDKSRFRKSDIPILEGSYRKAKSIGWSPEYKLEQTLKDTLNYWRNKTK
jgi:GDP-4-dehydro-6-deoxy-D-mannose reductase